MIHKSILKRQLTSNKFEHAKSLMSDDILINIILIYSYNGINPHNIGLLKIWNKYYEVRKYIISEKLEITPLHLFNTS